MKDEGKQYGRWTVIGEGQSKNRQPYYLCRCSCGTVREVRVARLESGKSQSCGCLQKELMSTRRKKHGETNSRIHIIWRMMKQRCQNPNHNSYKYYGGRGITVCPEWCENFEAFRDWALANGYQENLTIDRINNDGPYSPENCRWSTMKEQDNNKSNNRLITIEKETHNVSEWGEIKGISRDTIMTRLSRGWKEQDAVMTPAGGRR